MTKNNNLNGARSTKNDEFYTQLTDIEKEMVHYKDHFKDKVVLCNCNDAIHRNFAQYFALNFEFLGLKKLICTSYGDGDENGKVFIYTGDKNGNNIPEIDEWEQYELNGKGDFRSDACIEFLKESDIVVTNPPFSLFREFITQLIEYDKKFIIIGNMNAITYGEVFPFIKDNKIWLGMKNINTNMSFTVPQDSEPRATRYWVDETGQKWRSLGNACWYTNLDHKKRHEKLDLYKHYNPEENPKYDNYDAIEVSKTADIPMDYEGAMGVPVTFLDKYCPEQFELIDALNNPYLNGKSIYKRLIIKPKK